MMILVSGAISAGVEDEIKDLLKPSAVSRRGSSTLAFEGGLDPQTSRNPLARLCEANKLDFAYLQTRDRLQNFKVLAMDMDSTLITIECIDEMAALAGKSEEVSAITRAAMRGEVRDFASSLKQRLSFLADCPQSILETVYDTRLRLTAGAQELLQAAKRNRLKTMLVSGGFDYFTERLQRQLSFDYAYANHLEILDGRLSGRVTGRIIDGAAKADLLDAVLQANAVTKKDAIVVGDGANDLPMMTDAGLSVAFHAKELVRNTADSVISFGTLDVLTEWLSD